MANNKQSEIIQGKNKLQEAYVGRKTPNHLGDKSHRVEEIYVGKVRPFKRVYAKAKFFLSTNDYTNDLELKENDLDKLQPYILTNKIARTYKGYCLLNFFLRFNIRYKNYKYEITEPANAMNENYPDWKRQWYYEQSDVRFSGLYNEAEEIVFDIEFINPNIVTGSHGWNSEKALDAIRNIEFKTDDYYVLDRFERIYDKGIIRLFIKFDLTKPENKERLVDPDFFIRFIIKEEKISYDVKDETNITPVSDFRTSDAIYNLPLQEIPTEKDYNEVSFKPLGKNLPEESVKNNLNIKQLIYYKPMPSYKYNIYFWMYKKNNNASEKENYIRTLEKITNVYDAGIGYGNTQYKAIDNVSLKPDAKNNFEVFTFKNWNKYELYQYFPKFSIDEHITEALSSLADNIGYFNYDWKKAFAGWVSNQLIIFTKPVIPKLSIVEVNTSFAEDEQVITKTPLTYQYNAVQTKDFIYIDILNKPSLEGSKFDKNRDGYKYTGKNWMIYNEHEWDLRYTKCLNYPRTITRIDKPELEFDSDGVFTGRIKIPALTNLPNLKIVYDWRSDIEGIEDIIDIRSGSYIPNKIYFDGVEVIGNQIKIPRKVGEKRVPILANRLSTITHECISITKPGEQDDIVQPKKPYTYEVVWAKRWFNITTKHVGYGEKEILNRYNLFNNTNLEIPIKYQLVANSGNPEQEYREISYTQYIFPYLYYIDQIKIKLITNKEYDGYTHLKNDLYQGDINSILSNKFNQTTTNEQLEFYEKVLVPSNGNRPFIEINPQMYGDFEIEIYWKPKQFHFHLDKTMNNNYNALEDSHNNYNTYNKTLYHQPDPDNPLGNLVKSNMIFVQRQFYENLIRNNYDYYKEFTEQYNTHINTVRLAELPNEEIDKIHKRGSLYMLNKNNLHNLEVVRYNPDIFNNGYESAYQKTIKYEVDSMKKTLLPLSEFLTKLPPHISDIFHEINPVANNFGINLTNEDRLGLISISDRNFIISLKRYAHTKEFHYVMYPRINRVMDEREIDSNRVFYYLYTSEDIKQKNININVKFPFTQDQHGQRKVEVNLSTTLMSNMFHPFGFVPINTDGNPINGYATFITRNILNKYLLNPITNNSKTLFNFYGWSEPLNDITLSQNPNFYEKDFKTIGRPYHLNEKNKYQVFYNWNEILKEHDSDNDAYVVRRLSKLFPNTNQETINLSYSSLLLPKEVQIFNDKGYALLNNPDGTKELKQLNNKIISETDSPMLFRNYITDQADLGNSHLIENFNVANLNNKPFTYSNYINGKMVGTCSSNNYSIEYYKTNNMKNIIVIEFNEKYFQLDKTKPFIIFNMNNYNIYDINNPIPWNSIKDDITHPQFPTYKYTFTNISTNKLGYKAYAIEILYDEEPVGNLGYSVGFVSAIVPNIHYKDNFVIFKNKTSSLPEGKITYKKSITINASDIPINIQLDSNETLLGWTTVPGSNSHIITFPYTVEEKNITLYPLIRKAKSTVSLGFLKGWDTINNEPIIDYVKWFEFDQTNSIKTIQVPAPLYTLLKSKENPNISISLEESFFDQAFLITDLKQGKGIKLRSWIDNLTHINGNELDDELPDENLAYLFNKNLKVFVDISPIAQGDIIFTPTEMTVTKQRKHLVFKATKYHYNYNTFPFNPGNPLGVVNAHNDDTVYEAGYTIIQNPLYKQYEAAIPGLTHKQLLNQFFYDLSEDYYRRGALDRPCLKVNAKLVYSKLLDGSGGYLPEYVNSYDYVSYYDFNNVNKPFVFNLRTKPNGDIEYINYLDSPFYVHDVEFNSKFNENIKNNIMYPMVYTFIINAAIHPKVNTIKFKLVNETYGINKFYEYDLQQNNSYPFKEIVYWKLLATNGPNDSLIQTIPLDNFFSHIKKDLILKDINYLRKYPYNQDPDWVYFQPIVYNAVNNTLQINYSNPSVPPFGDIILEFTVNGEEVDFYTPDGFERNSSGSLIQKHKKTTFNSLNITKQFNDHYKGLTGNTIDYKTYVPNIFSFNMVEGYKYKQYLKEDLFKFSLSNFRMKNSNNIISNNVFNNVSIVDINKKQVIENETFNNENQKLIYVLPHEDYYGTNPSTSFTIYITSEIIPAKNNKTNRYELYFNYGDKNNVYSAIESIKHVFYITNRNIRNNYTFTHYVNKNFDENPDFIKKDKNDLPYVEVPYNNGHIIMPDEPFNETYVTNVKDVIIRCKDIAKRPKLSSFKQYPNGESLNGLDGAEIVVKKSFARSDEVSLNIKVLPNKICPVKIINYEDEANIQTINAVIESNNNIDTAQLNYFTSTNENPYNLTQDELFYTPSATDTQHIVFYIHAQLKDEFNAINVDSGNVILPSDKKIPLFMKAEIREKGGHITTNLESHVSFASNKCIHLTEKNPNNLRNMASLKCELVIEPGYTKSLSVYLKTFFHLYNRKHKLNLYNYNLHNLRYKNNDENQGILAQASSKPIFKEFQLYPNKKEFNINTSNLIVGLSYNKVINGSFTINSSIDDSVFLEKDYNQGILSLNTTSAIKRLLLIAINPKTLNFKSNSEFNNFRFTSNAIEFFKNTDGTKPLTVYVSPVVGLISNITNTNDQMKFDISTINLININNTVDPVKARNFNYTNHPIYFSFPMNYKKIASKKIYKDKPFDKKFYGQFSAVKTKLNEIQYINTNPEETRFKLVNTTFDSKAILKTKPLYFFIKTNKKMEPGETYSSDYINNWNISNDYIYEANELKPDQNPDDGIVIEFDE